MNNMSNNGGGSSSYLSRMTSMAQPSMWTTISIIVVVIILCIAIYFIYKQQISPLLQPGYRANSENKPTGGGGGNLEAELMLFYVDWCPHCKTAKPEWEQLKAEYEGKQINGYRVVFTEINCTNESPEVEKMISTYKIEGYPTIKLLKDGQIIEYDAKPTKATLEQFLNTVL